MPPNLPRYVGMSGLQTQWQSVAVCICNGLDSWNMIMHHGRPSPRKLLNSKLQNVRGAPAAACPSTASFDNFLRFLSVKHHPTSWPLHPNLTGARQEPLIRMILQPRQKRDILRRREPSAAIKSGSWIFCHSSWEYQHLWTVIENFAPFIRSERTSGS